jgi:hypothetical protein
MKHATTRELFSYWSRLRAQRAAPERADVDPAAIRNILADAFILEIDNDVDYPLRVVGARVNAIFGRELKGVPFVSLWREEDRSALRAMIEVVPDESLPALAGATTCPRGRVRVELELLLLPLRHNGRTHARMLGALSPGAIPSWLGLLPAEPMSLTSTRIIGVEEGRFRRAEQIGQSIVDAPGLHKPEPARRRHLFVHEGGR